MADVEPYDDLAGPEFGHSGPHNIHEESYLADHPIDCVVVRGNNYETILVPNRSNAYRLDNALTGTRWPWLPDNTRMARPVTRRRSWIGFRAARG